MGSEREFDVVLFGATGFTGRLVAEYLCEFHRGDARWAMAGRNLAKLKEVQAEIASRYPEVAEIPLLVADSHDASSLRALAARTKVVCTTVGPYAKYGNELVAACVAEGTDYCDLTGEVQWIRRMVDAHHDEAVRTGARIVHCCGFDSVPSDLGQWLLQTTSMERHGAPATHVRLYVRKAKGGFSGGTVASMMNLMEEARDPAVRRILGNPYSLLPEGERKGPHRGDPNGVGWSAEVQGWTGPFVMASVNSRVVRRSNALLGFPWTRELNYAEMTRTGKGVGGFLSAAALAGGLGAFVAAAAVPPVRKLMQKTILPAPGQGPTAEAIANGFFEIELVGRTEGGAETRVRVKGHRDPGYGATACMLAESALCLAQDAPAGLQGGVLTPASALSSALMQRLNQTLVQFEAQPAS